MISLSSKRFGVIDFTISVSLFGNNPVAHSEDEMLFNYGFQIDLKTGKMSCFSAWVKISLNWKKIIGSMNYVVVFCQGHQSVNNWLFWSVACCWQIKIINTDEWEQWVIALCQIKQTPFRLIRMVEPLKGLLRFDEIVMWTASLKIDHFFREQLLSFNWVWISGSDRWLLAEFKAYLWCLDES